MVFFQQDCSDVQKVYNGVPQGIWNLAVLLFIIDVSNFTMKCMFQLIEAEWRIHVSENYTIIGSDKSLSPARRQAIIWTNDGILLIRPLSTHFSYFLSKLKHFHWQICIWKCRLPKWRPFCPGFNVLNMVADDAIISISATTSDEL